jgi:chromosome partitioning protein
MWVVVQEAIRAATLVIIPARPGFFDLDSVRETIAAARQREKPFAVVLNAAPAKREDREAPVLMQSREALDREGVPVWSGQISQRATFSLSLAAGASVCEAAPDSAAAAGGAPLRSSRVRNQGRRSPAAPG